MNEPENFLTRWSRRKLEAEDAEPAEKKSEQPLAKDGVSAKDPPGQPGDAAEPAFDLSKLPSLDSITANTDIRAFWLPGVPETLRHAALRRAWVADPAIRDLVDLAEYAWDFNAVGAMGGFGPLDPAEVPKLMKTFLGTPEPDEPGLQRPQQSIVDPAIKDTQSTDATRLASKPTDDAGADDSPTASESPSQAQAESSLPLDNKALSHRSEEKPTPPAQVKQPSPHPAQRHRGHGRALPQ